MRSIHKYLSLLLIFTMGTFTVPRVFLHDCNEVDEHHASHHESDGETSLHSSCFACDFDLNFQDATTQAFEFARCIQNPVFASLTDNPNLQAWQADSGSRAPPRC